MPLAASFTEYGDVSQVQIVEVPPLHAGPGQVRLATRAAGVNPIDWKTVNGLVQHMIQVDFPGGLGADVSGVVDEVGEGVTEFAVGDEVFGRSTTPSYAESALADAAWLLPKPAALSWVEAAALPGVGGTASLVIDKLALKAGETLLIHAAAGGVGVFAIQLATARGARVIGTASASNHELLRSLGAEPVTYGDGLEDRVRALVPDGVDAVLDPSGRGEIPVSIELAGGPERVLTIKAFDQAETGIQVHLAGAGEDAAALERIFDLIPVGQLQVPIWKTFSLRDAASALAESQAGHLGGKIVITTADVDPTPGS